MSLWDNILNTVKGVGSAFGLSQAGAQAASSAVQGVADIAAQQIAGTQAPKTVQGLQTAAQQALAKSPAKIATPGQTSDVLLNAAMPVGEAFSQANRAISTIGLLKDKNVSDIGLSDIKKAYNRSAKVSMFQSITQTSIFQDSPFGQASDLFLKAGNVDLKKVNLWSDADIKKNFVDNPVGKWYTGVGDFVTSNLYGGAVTKLAGEAIKAIPKIETLSTSIKSEQDLAKMAAEADAHITHISTNGLSGTKTPFGQDIQNLASNKDINYIIDKVRDYSNNEHLPGLIAKTNNPTVIKDLILADKGFLPSIESLGNSVHTTDLWQLKDMSAFIAGNVASTGKLPTYSGESLGRILAAYDSSVAEIPGHKEILDAFLSNNEPKYLGNSYKPMEANTVTNAIAKAKSSIDAFKAAATTRDFTNVGGWTETVLGGGRFRPVTRLMRIAGTSMPHGYVSFSGTTPFDGVDELNAIFDSMPSFKFGDNKIATGIDIVNGQTLPIYATASEYRSQWIKKFIDANGPTAKAKVLDDLDKVLGHDLARTHGILDTNKINAMVAEARQTLNTTHGGLSSTGFAFDAAGNRVIVDPQTQSQLANAVAMLPWDKIEKDMIVTQRALGGTLAGEAFWHSPTFAHNFFESLNRVFSFSVLGHPSYIFKNSMIEPLTGATMAMGHDYWSGLVKGGISNFVENNKNRILSGASKVLKGKELRQANHEVQHVMDMLNEALQARDVRYAEWHNAFETDNLSPVTKRENLALIKANLQESQQMVTRLEVAADLAVNKFGKLEDIPSLYGLRRRIDFLKANPEVSALYGSEIRAAEILLQRSAGDLATLAPNLAEQNARLEQAWKAIDSTIQKAKLTEQAQADILAERIAYKKRTYGTAEPRTVRFGNQTVTIDPVFDVNKAGDALRSEFSNEKAQELSFLGESRTGTKVGLNSRRGAASTVNINDPLYFEELAYIINHQFRNDSLIMKILSGTSDQELFAWAKTAEGKSYFGQFAQNVPENISSMLNDRINFVKRYIPNDAARLTVSQEPATSVKLKQLLAKDLDKLTAIHPSEIDYGSASTPGGLKKANEIVTSLTNGAWKKLAAAENPFRWVWAEKQWAQTVEDKLTILHNQGYKVTDQTVNAVRQAANRETLQNASKVFYNVDRQNRALYIARTVAAFPTASASSIYRFGKLGIKYPGRMTGFLRNYYSTYNTFGVDKNGNPVSDPRDAEYLVIPGTKEMGFNHEKGVLLSTKSTGFLANMPGPSWLTTLALTEVYKWKPDSSKLMKGLVDSTIGHLPGMDYNSLFPTGVNATVSSSFLPGWLNDAKLWLTGSDASAEYLQVHSMVNDYRMTLWEMKLGPKPTMESIMNETNNWFRNRFTWRFASLIGITPQQDKPGQLFQNLASTLMKKYNGDTNKVQAEMQQILGPAFPTDRYTYRGSAKNVYFSPTYEGYNRVIQENSDLTKKLIQLGSNSKINTVGFMTSDITGDPDPQIQKYLSDPRAKLPGGNLINGQPITPEQYEIKLSINRSWDAFRNYKQDLLTAVQKAGYKRVADSPEAKAAMDSYVAQLQDYSPEWFDEYKQNAAGNNAYTVARAFQDIIDNKKFWDKNGKNDYWQQVSAFMGYRNEFVKAYNSKEAKAAKAQTSVQQAWIDFLHNDKDTAGKWTPQLQQIIDRYFINDTLAGTK